MNKLTGLMGAALLAGSVLAGCSADSENAVPEEKASTGAVTPVETEQAQIDETETTKIDEAETTKIDETKPAETSVTETADKQETAQKPESETTETPETPETAEEAGEAEPVAQETSATGTFNGIADPHTVEIEVNGETNAYQVEAGSEEMAKFQAAEEGSSVTFSYLKKGEQLVIKEVEAPVPAAEETEVTGVFNGIADPHTVEIEVNGEANAYQVEADSEIMQKFEQMTEGAEVTFRYGKNGEQLVITEVK